jgi:hypothetical protein
VTFVPVGATTLKTLSFVPRLATLPVTWTIGNGLSRPEGALSEAAWATPEPSVNPAPPTSPLEAIASASTAKLAVRNFT